MGVTRAAAAGVMLMLVLVLAAPAGAEEAKPVGEISQKLPGAIDPQPVNVQLMEEFWAHVHEWEARGKQAAAVRESEVRLAPGLEGGWVGWCLVVRVGAAQSARCPVAPKVPEAVAYERWEASGSGTRGVALVSTQYEAVAVDDANFGLAVTPVAGVEGLAAALAQLPAAFPGPAGWFDEFEPVIHGVRLSVGRGWAGPERDYAAALPALGWKAPSPPAAGACALTASRLRGLRARSGHVATALPPTPGIAGGGFASCVDVEYAFAGSGFDAALLLNPAEPGGSGSLAGLPGARPVPHHRGYVSAPGWNGQILARREGNGWLAVEGGSSLRRRLQVLEHLRGHVG